MCHHEHYSQSVSQRQVKGRTGMRCAVKLLSLSMLAPKSLASFNVTPKVSELLICLHPLMLKSMEQVLG